MDVAQLIIKFGKPSNELCGKASAEFFYLPYGFIKIDLPALLEEDQIQAAMHVMKMQFPDDDFGTASGNEISAFLLWIAAEYEKIAVIEQQYLSSEPEMEMIAAGIMKLNEFGAYATVDQLAGGDILKHAEIKAMPYYEVYQKLKLDKVNREIEKAYQKIITEKSKKIK